jgi:hypothetical protein
VSPDPAAGWAGCHGVRVTGGELDLGRASGTPIAEATLVVGPVAPPAGTELWRLHAEREVEGVKREVDRWLCHHPDGQFVVHATAGPGLAVDAGTGRVTIEPGGEAVSLQLLVTFGLPLLLNSHPALVLHASACERDGEATVVCGLPGSGKSSALVGMIDAGWRALSEDVCAVDLRSATPVVWPGPPWVRRSHGEAGPKGADVRFETPDKTAWDIARVQHDAPVPMTRLVFLDPPGGDAPRWQTLSQPEAIKALATHAVWLRDPEEAGRELFGLSATVTSHVTAARLRLPRRTSWLEELPAVLQSAR